MTHSREVLDHFERPRNVGDVPSPTAVAELENPVCGDTLRLSGKVADGKIAELKFKAKGCVSTVACASAITVLMTGLSVEEARTFERERLVEYLGGLSPETMHASHLAVETLQALLKKL